MSSCTTGTVLFVHGRERARVAMVAVMMRGQGKAALRGEPERRSRNALRESSVAFPKDPGFTLKFRSDPPLVAESGEMRVAVGTLAVSFTDPNTQEVIRQMTAHDN